MSVVMNSKSVFLILSIFIIFISIFCVDALQYNAGYGDLNLLLDETNESDMFGCCSIACQLDGNESIFAFRRDARYGADIHIEEVNWHGKEAIRQYKETGGYFCQVIITNDGWTIGFGGSDDGDVNKQIEEITGKMVESGKIDNATLEQIQSMKAPYKKGHALIKSPDGQYGVATADSHFTGKLKPGDYISVPNKPSYIRTGDIQMNSSDKVKILHKLEMSDAFGVDRRDITSFFFHKFENDTFVGNITDIAISNDDGSVYNIKNNSQLADDVIFNGTTIKAKDIPFGPNYKEIGSVDFLDKKPDNPFGFVLYIVILILFVIIFALIIRTINKIRYARKLRKRRNQYRSLYRDDRYRYR